MATESVPKKTEKATRKFPLVIQQKMTAWFDDSEKETILLRVTPFDEIVEHDIEREAVWVDVATDVESRQAADEWIKRSKASGIYRVSAFQERVLTEIPTPSFKLS